MTGKATRQFVNHSTSLLRDGTFMKLAGIANPRAAGSSDKLPHLDAGRDVRDDAETLWAERSS